MANFSTLFPNLNGGLDFTSGSATGTAQQIYGWAQADDDSVIPLSKLPALSLGHTHTYTTTATTHPAALAAFRAAFNAAGTASAGITVAVGTALNAGDILILTAAGGIFESYLYTGAALVADAGAGNTVAEADFIDITNAGDGVTNLAGGTNLNTTGNVETGSVTVNLDASIAGITNINTTAATNLILGNAGATLNIDSSTFDVDATSVDITSTGNTVLAAGNNGLATLSAGTGAAAEVRITSQGTGASAVHVTSSGGVNIDASGDVDIAAAHFDVATSGLLQLSSNVASGTAIDIDATQSAGTININAVGTAGAGSIVIDAGAGELRIGGEDIDNGTASVSRVLGIGANGQLTTNNITVGGGAQTVNLLTDADNQSITTNVVNVIPTLATTGRSFAVAGGLAIGSYFKIVNNPANITNQATIVLNGSETFLGASATPGSLVLNDNTANFEVIKIAAGTGANTWAIITS